MKVILLQDIANLGKKWDVKEVKDGHARNYLIPRGLAKIATFQALKNLGEQRELEAKRAEEELKVIQEQASLIDGQEVIIPVKVGEKGKIFGSINQDLISEKLHAMGFRNIKKSQIVLEKPIKELGEFPVLIKFEHNLEAEIKVIVVEEK